VFVLEVDVRSFSNNRKALTKLLPLSVTVAVSFEVNWNSSWMASNSLAIISYVCETLILWTARHALFLYNRNC
jgi:hypothetical protein